MSWVMIGADSPYIWIVAADTRNNQSQTTSKNQAPILPRWFGANKLFTTTWQNFNKGNWYHIINQNSAYTNIQLQTH
jgi:hypothetical protein